MNKCFKCGELKSPMTFIAGCAYSPKCYAEFENKPYESFQDYYEELYGIEI